MPSPYTELHTHSNFSFLEGASHIEEMVLRARSWVYYSLLLEDGRTVTVYSDLVSGQWARQDY